MRGHIRERVKELTIQQLIVEGICLLIVIAGVITSIKMNLVGRSLWYDESALAYSFCQRGFWELTASELDYVQSAPVGWLYAVKILAEIFGYSTYVLRTPAILSYVGMLILVYLILKKVFKTYYPMAGAAFCAALPILLQYSNMFKPYISDCFITLLVIWFYHLYDSKKISALVLGILWAVCIWFSNPACFVEGGLILSTSALAIVEKKKTVIFEQIKVFFLIGASFIVYYFYWLRQTAVENTDMINFWEGYDLPLIPTSLEDLRSFKSLVGLLFEPFYRLIWIVLIMLAAFVFLVIWKKSVILIGMYLSFFVAAVASSIGMFPVNKRLWLFIYPMITIILFAGMDAFIQKKDRRHFSSYVIGTVMLGVCVLNAGIRYYWNDENVYWPGYEVQMEYDYLVDHIQSDEWVYVFQPIIPEFAYINHYNNTTLGDTGCRVMLGTAPLGTNYDYEDDLNEILESEKCYVFMSDSWDREDYTNELFKQAQEKGHFEMVYNDYATPLWYYCQDIENVKSDVSYEIVSCQQEENVFCYTVRINNIGEAYLNPKFQTLELKNEALHLNFGLPKDIAPGASVDLEIRVPQEVFGDTDTIMLSLENEYGIIGEGAELFLPVP